MLKKILIILAVWMAGMSSAMAATAVVSTESVNLRAGPATTYPLMSVVPQGSRVLTHGCVDGYTRCDITSNQYRGWVSASYIQMVDQGQPVFLSAAVALAVAPRVESQGRSVTCVNGNCNGTRSATSTYGGSTIQTRNCSGGNCSATRETMGRYGNSASRVRSCSASDLSCNMTRAGPLGGTASETRVFSR